MEAILQYPVFQFRKINFAMWGYRLGILALCVVLVAFMIACSTTWLVQLENYLPVAFQAANGVIAILAALGVAGGLAVPVSQAVETAVTQGLTMLCGQDPNNSSQCNPSSLVGQYNSAPSASLLVKIQATITDLQSQLTQWLTLIHIKAANVQASIIAAVTLIQTTIAAIAARIGTAAAVFAGAAPNVVAAPKIPKMPISVKQFKAQYNSLVTFSGYGQFSIK